MARHGKIARLPKWLRDALNQKLQDGESGVAVVAWLNEMWGKNEAVANAVGEEPVNEQNLSAWRQGGYREWERRREAVELVHGLGEHAQDLKQEAHGLEVSDRLSLALTGELARVAEALLVETTNPRERWELLKEVLRELTRVRQMDHRASKLAREQADWEQARQKTGARQAGLDAAEAAERLHSKTLWATICAADMAKKGGNTESDRAAAAATAETAFGLPPGTIVLSAECGVGTTGNPPLDCGAASEGEAADLADEAESRGIKENQGECGVRNSECEVGTAIAAEEQEGAGVPTANPAPDVREPERGLPPAETLPDQRGLLPAEDEVPQEVRGPQFAVDGMPLPPGVHWKLVRHPIQDGRSAKMILVNAAGEEVGQDGQPILKKCGVRSSECGMGKTGNPPSLDHGPTSEGEAADLADEGESRGIKLGRSAEFGMGTEEKTGNPPDSAPAVLSTIVESPGDGLPVQAKEPPEEWEDGGWMKKRPRTGG